MQGDAHAAFGYILMLTIGKPPHIFDAENLEYVVEAGTELHVGAARVHHIDHILSRETPQVGILLGKQRVVLVGKIPEETRERLHLSDAQHLDPGNAVEEDSVGKVSDVPRGIGIEHKLHGAHQAI